MTISPTNSTTSAGDTASRLPMQTLDQDDFLKLLVAQLTSQDPLNPQKDTDFIAQMAQFSALEQAKAMQGDVAQLRAEQQVLQAYGLLGQTVDLAIDGHTTAQGIVSAVQLEAGTPKLMVNGGSYTLGQVLTVYPPAGAETQN
ncbi:MAG: flagellar hook capping FlgD N-terminal domain-containing protein [Verrucomicrobiota bacterium]